nr:hypothetical protein [Streptomyces noursei]
MGHERLAPDPPAAAGGRVRQAGADSHRRHVLPSAGRNSLAGRPLAVVGRRSRRHLGIPHGPWLEP